MKSSQLSKVKLEVFKNIDACKNNSSKIQRLFILNDLIFHSFYRSSLIIIFTFPDTKEFTDVISKLIRQFVFISN